MNANKNNRVVIPPVKRWAVFVGVNHYRDEYIPSLRYCVNDARALHDLLVGSTYSGYAPERARLLLSESPSSMDAARRNILKQLQELADNTRPDDMLLFYFAGHGQPINQEVYLVPADAEHNGMIQDTALPLSRIKEILEGSAARARAIILDACFTGVPLRGAARGGEAQESAILEKLLLESEGMAILHSTARNDAAFEWPEMEHGVFTYYLLQGLRGEANARQDGVLTVTELHRFVCIKVGEWARQHGISMHPTLEFRGRGDLVLAATDMAGAGPQAWTQDKDDWFPNMQYASADALLGSLRGGQPGFVGRTKELQRVLKLIHTAPNMASLVVGWPGLGKTSFFNQIKYRLAAKGADKDLQEQRRFHVFSIEPGMLSSCDEFAAELRTGMLRCLGPLAAQEYSEVHRLGAFGEYSAQLEAIQQQLPTTTFVVFLDEFDKIFKQCTDLEQRRIRELINMLAEHERLSIMFVLSVTQDLPTDYASHFPADPFHLHTLSRAENDRLVNDLLSRYSAPAAAELERIYDLTGGHPYLTRLLAVKLLDLAPWVDPQSGIGDAQLTEAARAAVHSDRADLLFGAVYESFLTDAQRFVLLNLAANGQRVLTADDFARLMGKHKHAVKALKECDYFLELPDGAYHMRIGMFFEWLFAWDRFDSELEWHKVTGQTTPTDNARRTGRSGLSIDQAAHRIFIDGNEVAQKLQDLPYRALICLAQRAGQVVTKDDLANALWPSESHEVDDQRIATVVSRLRQALGDHEETYIETLPKQGYRLRSGALD